MISVRTANPRFMSLFRLARVLGEEGANPGHTNMFTGCDSTAEGVVGIAPMKGGW